MKKSRFGTQVVAVLFIMALLAVTPMAGIAEPAGADAADRGTVFTWNDTELSVSKFLTGDAVSGEEAMNGSKYWTTDPEMSTTFFPNQKAKGQYMEFVLCGTKEVMNSAVIKGIGTAARLKDADGTEYEPVGAYAPIAKIVEKKSVLISSVVLRFDVPEDCDMKTLTLLVDGAEVWHFVEK